MCIFIIDNYALTTEDMVILNYQIKSIYLLCNKNIINTYIL